MACVHPVEEGSQSEFYEYSNAPAGLENGGRILQLLKKDTELPPASQSVSHSVSWCVCMAISDFLSLTQEPSHSELNK